MSSQYRTIPEPPWKPLAPYGLRFATAQQATRLHTEGMNAFSQGDYTTAQAERMRRT